MTGFEFTVKEMERAEQFREDERIILDYCRKKRREKAEEKRVEANERQVSHGDR